MRTFKKGDLVIYRMQKTSMRPSPRAKGVRPSEHGDRYTYVVDKYWTVARMIDQDTVEIIIRCGKIRRLPVIARQLRKAQPLERFRLRQRFPRGPSSVTA